MPSAKRKQPYLRAIWRLPTAPAVGTAGGGASRAGAGTAAAAGGRGGVRTSSGEAGAEVSDIIMDQKNIESKGEVLYIVNKGVIT
jgi:hypothetical protein